MLHVVGVLSVVAASGQIRGRQGKEIHGKL